LKSVGSGTYNILTGSSSTACIDLDGSGTGLPIEQNTCNGSASQVFQIAAPGQVSVAISPTSAAVSSGATQQFTATVSGSTNTAVTWSTSAGSISTSGLLTAPSVTSTTSVTVTATSQASTTISASAIITVNAPTTVSVAVSPTSATVSSSGTQQFSATVSGTSNTAVTWSTSAGSISTSGLLTAPSVTSSTAVTVKATSQASTTSSASATVTVNPPSTVSVAVSPASATVSSGGTQQFTATVSGSSNTAVTWSTSSGSISSSGVLTAPTCTSNMSVTVKATSQASTSASAAASVTVNAPTVSISISPTSSTISSGGTQQYTATVSGSTNTAVTWSTTDGSISTSGLYTAPAVSSNTNASITATSEANTSKYVSATITIDPAATATAINPKNYGATGNGTTDDTAAINSAIAALKSGSELQFPAGTYLVSALNPVTVSNVTIDGSSNTAKIISTTTQQGPIFTVGQSGVGMNSVTCAGWPGTGTGVDLSTTANAQSTTFTTESPLSGVSAGSYVLLVQGGIDGNATSTVGGAISTATECDTASCRGELVKILSVSGSTYTVTTMLHDSYSPTNAALACPVPSMVSNVTVQNITFDGGTTTAQTSGNTWGVEFNDCAGCTLSGVTVQNVLGAALLHNLNYGTTFSNITITGAGSEDCGAAVAGWGNANMTLNTISLSALNPSSYIGSCLGDGGFGLEEDMLANSTSTGITVNAAGTAGGRPMKLEAANYNTFNSLIVENGQDNFNGLAIDYYSTYNNFNSCQILNNSTNGGSGTGNAGINLWGDFVSYNTFSNCTVTGNGNVQIYDSPWWGTSPATTGLDVGNAFIGNTVGGSGTYGLLLYGTNDCVNGNTLQSGLSAGLSIEGSGEVGLGNVLGGTSSNLTAGTCSAP